VVIVIPVLYASYEYLTSNQKVLICTTPIKKVIAKLCSFILRNNIGWDISQRLDILIDTGSGNFFNLRIRLLFRLRLLSIQRKFTHVFTYEITTQTPITAEIEIWFWIRVLFFTNFWPWIRVRKKKAESTPARRIHGHFWSVMRDHLLWEKRCSAWSIVRCRKLAVVVWVKDKVSLIANILFSPHFSKKDGLWNIKYCSKTDRWNYVSCFVSLCSVFLKVVTGIFGKQYWPV